VIPAYPLLLVKSHSLLSTPIKFRRFLLSVCFSFLSSLSVPDFSDVYPSPPLPLPRRCLLRSSFLPPLCRPVLYDHVFLPPVSIAPSRSRFSLPWNFTFPSVGLLRSAPTSPKEFSSSIQYVPIPFQSAPLSQHRSFLFFRVLERSPVWFPQFPDHLAHARVLVPRLFAPSLCLLTYC